MKKENKDLATKIAHEIIDKVEKEIKKHVGKKESGRFMKIGADGTPTSYIDIVAEDIVIDVLNSYDDAFYLISEEIGELKIHNGVIEEVQLYEEVEKDTPNPGKLLFLIDPLDGTSNAIKEIPAYGISVAVAEIKKDKYPTLEDVELGFIKNFSNGNFFHAEKGKGAWLNGKTQTPSKETRISNISLGGFTKNSTTTASKLIDTARRMRVLGSVVLELSYVGSGKYDAFLDLRGSRIIDIAASKLIVEESGAVITNNYGEKLDNKLSIHERAIVVASGNEELHEEIIDILNDNEAEVIGDVGIVSRVDDYKSILFSLKVIEFLLNSGINIIIEETLAYKLEELKKNPGRDEIIKETSDKNPELREYLKDLKFNIEFTSYCEKLSDFTCDMVIILGGDGTLLRSQSQMTEEIPIFGINMGTVGFLTEIEVKDTFQALKNILKGKYYIEKRTQLRISHESQRFSALNEVVIMTDQTAKMLHFQVQVDNEVIEEFRADGLIISTPSGSTAYSMSAGGPILDPKVGGFIIIPICPFKLGVRPFIVSDNSEIKVKLLKKGKKAIFVADGQINEKVKYMDEIRFKKSENKVQFIRTSTKYFYKKVKDKLTEGGLNNENNCL
ncbi:bifunctional NADP phosphatase/NAD kinase [Methanobrevibacter sp. OttesenSCG-928-K11]|nr:bifunctional NADP phosphatase/NAD kinase [Methanobrevibacter sp. OttesenSCG-928-K11]MDL2270940.1 bifunctional NADP phosphatase/NAD kinase [Methanobrevibacter sp. OttesenSCG-928-I08]